MDSIGFSCPRCNQSLEAPTAMTTKAIKCPACGGPITVPDVTGIEAEMNTPVCGNCGTAMPNDGLVCMTCGWDRRSGRCLTTFAVPVDGEQGTKEELKVYVGVKVGWAMGFWFGLYLTVAGIAFVGRAPDGGPVRSVFLFGGVFAALIGIPTLVKFWRLRSRIKFPMGVSRSRDPAGIEMFAQVLALMVPTLFSILITGGRYSTGNAHTVSGIIHEAMMFSCLWCYITFFLVALVSTYKLNRNKEERVGARFQVWRLLALVVSLAMALALAFLDDSR